VSRAARVGPRRTRRCGGHTLPRRRSRADRAVAPNAKRLRCGQVLDGADAGVGGIRNRSRSSQAAPWGAARLTRPDALRLRLRVATCEPLGRTHRRATLHVGDLAVAEGDHLEALLPPAMGAGPSSGPDDRVLTDLPVLRLHLDAPRAPLL